MTINIIGDTMLIRVENDAAAVGREMARTGGSADVDKVPGITNLIRGLDVDSPIRLAVLRGYHHGYAAAAVGLRSVA